MHWYLRTTVHLMTVSLVMSISQDSAAFSLGLADPPGVTGTL